MVMELLWRKLMQNKELPNLSKDMIEQKYIDNIKVIHEALDKIDNTERNLKNPDFLWSIPEDEQ